MRQGGATDKDGSDQRLDRLKFGYSMGSPVPLDEPPLGKQGAALKQPEPEPQTRRAKLSLLD